MEYYDNMGKTWKEVSYKSKDFEKIRQQRKKSKHTKLEPYNRKKNDKRTKSVFTIS